MMSTTDLSVSLPMPKKTESLSFKSNARKNTQKVGKQMSKGQKTGNFPSDQEIEDFQAQLNSDSIKNLATAFKNHFTTLKQKVQKPMFTKFLNESFKDPEVAPDLINSMYERFKPFRLEGTKDETHVVQEGGMDVLDFILALNLLARIVYDKKLKLLFELCDDDDDGCMTPDDILNML